MSGKKILVVVTNVSRYPDMDRPTGLWLGEAVHFVDAVEKAGCQVDFVSPRGGYTPIDPMSLAEMALPIDWEYYEDHAFMNRLGNTMAAPIIDPSCYSAIYYAGGHGVIWDFPGNKHLQTISRDIYESGGVVSSVCHGAVGLLNVQLSDGSYLVAGREVTGFSNEEERLAQLAEHVPYLTEEELVKRGAHYEKAEQPFTSFAVTSERLVTGQNPQSGSAVAEGVLALLGHTASV